MEVFEKSFRMFCRHEIWKENYYLFYNRSYLEILYFSNDSVKVLGHWNFLKTIQCANFLFEINGKSYIAVFSHVQCSVLSFSLSSNLKLEFSIDNSSFQSIFQICRFSNFILLVSAQSMLEFTVDVEGQKLSGKAVQLVSANKGTSSYVSRVHSDILQFHSSAAFCSSIDTPCVLVKKEFNSKFPVVIWGSIQKKVDDSVDPSTGADSIPTNDNASMKFEMKYIFPLSGVCKAVSFVRISGSEYGCIVLTNDHIFLLVGEKCLQRVELNCIYSSIEVNNDDKNRVNCSNCIVNNDTSSCVVGMGLFDDDVLISFSNGNCALFALKTQSVDNVSIISRVRELQKSRKQLIFEGFVSVSAVLMTFMGDNLYTVTLQNCCFSPSIFPCGFQSITKIPYHSSDTIGVGYHSGYGFQIVTYSKNISSKLCISNKSTTYCSLSEAGYLSLFESISIFNSLETGFQEQISCLGSKSITKLFPVKLIPVETCVSDNHNDSSLINNNKCTSGLIVCGSDDNSVVYAVRRGICSIITEKMSMELPEDCKLCGNICTYILNGGNTESLLVIVLSSRLLGASLTISCAFRSDMKSVAFLENNFEVECNWSSEIILHCCSVFRGSKIVQITSSAVKILNYALVSDKMPRVVYTIDCVEDLSMNFKRVSNQCLVALSESTKPEGAQYISIALVVDRKLGVLRYLEGSGKLETFMVTDLPNICHSVSVMQFDCCNLLVLVSFWEANTNNSADVRGYFVQIPPPNSRGEVSFSEFPIIKAGNEQTYEVVSSIVCFEVSELSKMKLISAVLLTHASNLLLVYLLCSENAKKYSICKVMVQSDFLNLKNVWKIHHMRDRSDRFPTIICDSIDGKQYLLRLKQLNPFPELSQKVFENLASEGCLVIISEQLEWHCDRNVSLEDVENSVNLYSTLKLPESRCLCTRLVVPNNGNPYLLANIFNFEEVITVPYFLKFSGVVEKMFVFKTVNALPATVLPVIEKNAKQNHGCGISLVRNVSGLPYYHFVLLDSVNLSVYVECFVKSDYVVTGICETNPFNNVNYDQLNKYFVLSVTGDLFTGLVVCCYCAQTTYEPKQADSFIFSKVVCNIGSVCIVKMIATDRILTILSKNSNLFTITEQSGDCKLSIFSWDCDTSASSKELKLSLTETAFQSLALTIGGSQLKNIVEFTVFQDIAMLSVFGDGIHVYHIQNRMFEKMKIEKLCVIPEPCRFYRVISWEAPALSNDDVLSYSAKFKESIEVKEVKFSWLGKEVLQSFTLVCLSLDKATNCSGTMYFIHGEQREENI